MWKKFCDAMRERRIEDPQEVADALVAELKRRHPDSEGVYLDWGKLSRLVAVAAYAAHGREEELIGR
jgi:hypothetical protein